MKLSVLAACLLSASIVCLGQTAKSPTPAPASDTELLLKLDRDYSRLAQEKGLDGFMQLFAENAVANPAKPAVGKEAIRRYLEPSWADFPNIKLTWEPTHAVMFKSGDMGYTSGRWTRKGKSKDGKTFERHGDYLTVWQKQTDGNWKAIWDGGSGDPK